MMPAPARCIAVRLSIAAARSSSHPSRAAALIMLVIAGALGILIITGVSFSLQKIGIAAGLATLILGQMVISVLADSKGWGGGTPVPVTMPRIFGLLVLAAGIYLLLPKK